MTDKIEKITFEYLVRAVRIATGYGYAKAAHLVDKAIEPQVAEQVAAAQVDIAANYAAQLTRYKKEITKLKAELKEGQNE